MLRRYVRPQDIPVVIALQVIVFTLSLATLLYAIGLLITSAFTFFTFDSSVWARNIDASPSPFPARVVFAPVLKMVGVRSPVDASTSPIMSAGHSAVCTGGDCSGSCGTSVTSMKPTRASLAPADLEIQSRRSAGEAESGLSVVGGLGEKARSSRSLQSTSVLDLIKIPDAVQKRQSIVVAFDDV
ncbi:hypothetical protein BDV98DRAFT_587580 [Pterulicium gracile]|uniref:Uncharacterized protein n=1 Tax=Pterulicium gracile TaxID=1884261 RepID=A0A5C3QYG4_9AGAR|nr:hypothetical protein BDV98DRAFT_587580 [Pterula gracilis]